MPSATAPVAGPMPTVPEQKTNLLAMIAWLYGPRAAGAESVDTACRITGYHLSIRLGVTLPGKRTSQASARPPLPVASRLGAGAQNDQLCKTMAAVEPPRSAAAPIGGSSVSSDQEFLTEGDGVIGSLLRQVGQRPPIGPGLG